MESRVEQAVALHQKGYNCAQAIICTYCDLFGVDEQTAYKMSEGFGLGMGMMETKGSTYKINRAMGEAFQKAAGSMLCAELKGRDTGMPLCSCEDCIRHGAKIVEEQLLSDR